MSNPVLNDKAMRDAAAKAGWGAPDPRTVAGGYRVDPITDGPISSWRPGVMTVGGTISATGVLMVLLLTSAALGWASTDTETGSFPPLAFVGIIVGLVAVVTLMFKPAWARVLAPIYALGQGFAVGAISRFYNDYQNGIVIQAVGATLATFVVMLVLYRTNIIKVTDRFRRIVIGATMGIMLLYLVSFVIRLFAGAGSVSFLDSPSALGIGLSVVVCVIAAMNLALDFDFIEKGSQNALPKTMEWYAALGLLVTIVWLYLEILRLLSKLDRR